MNKWSLIVQLLRHYKSAQFHTVIRIHLVSLSYHILVNLPSHFSSIMEQMLCYPRSLKELQNEIALLLKVIFECSLRAIVRYKEDWKPGNITPIF